MIELRDHSALCDHGWFITHDPDGGHCPGGRVVTIDYEAGLAVARELWTVEPVWDESSFALMLHAALGEP